MNTTTTNANVMAELDFTAAAAHPDPFNELTVDVLFTDPSGATHRVPAFSAGGNRFKARYASGVVGEHSFRSECSDANDRGLHDVKGVVRVEKYAGNNPLYRHGPLVVAPDRRHLQHSDGTPFLWLADTWWMGLSKRLKFPEEFARLAEDRKAKGFNVVQIVAGLYPDQPAFDQRAANEAGFPWEEEYQRIRPEYFDRADERIGHLVEQGFVPCIVGTWGYHLNWLGVEKMKQHLRYVVARYAALPVVWCVAGEFNLPFYLAPGFPHGGEAQAKQWESIIGWFRSINPFGRLVTAHPTGLQPLSGRGILSDPTLLDFDMLQTGHGDGILPQTIDTLKKSLDAKPIMPVLNSEVAYEALAGVVAPCAPDLVRRCAWVSLCGGALGHSYGANGIWQLNRKEQAYGNSPNGITYGAIPWDEAKDLPGSRELGLAAALLRAHAFEKCQLAPGLARWKNDSSDPKIPPCAIASPGEVAIIYVPAADEIVLAPLASSKPIAASIFDPETGEKRPFELPKPDAQGNRAVTPPAWKHDWVLVLDQRPR
jgi:hypothetical protein